MSYRYIVEPNPDGGLPFVRKVREKRYGMTSTLEAVSRMQDPHRTRLGTLLAVIVGERIERLDRAERYKILSHLAFYGLILGPTLIGIILMLG